MTDNPEKLAVKVELINDEGERLIAYGYGYDNNEAVQDAVAWAHDETGDDTYVMNEWWAA